MATVDGIRTRAALLTDAANAPILIIGTIVIYFGSFGFSITECGIVRSKNATMAIFKSFFILITAVIAYWTIGYAFAFGQQPGGSFIGGEYFALSDINDLIPVEPNVDAVKEVAASASETFHYARWFHTCALVVVTCLVPAGALAERSNLPVYLFYSVFISGFIFPVAVHWGQGEGWLAEGVDFTHNEVNYTTTYEDHSYCGAIHVVSGAVALAGTLMLGARMGRFPRREKTRLIRSHSSPMMAIGGVLSFLCLFMINITGVQTRSSDVPRAAVNTIISAATGCMFTMFVQQAVAISLNGRQAKTGMVTVINGLLTGVISVSAGSSVMEPWAACVAGIIGSIAYSSWSWALFNARIDDPSDAVAVHAGAGLWGIMAAAFLKRDVGLVYEWDRVSGMNFAWNLTGAVVMFGWGFLLAVLLFAALKIFGQLRIDKKQEYKGLDSKRLDEPAYPPSAYEEAARASSAPRYTEDYNSSYSMMMPLGLTVPPSVFNYPSPQRSEVQRPSITPY